MMADRDRGGGAVAALETPERLSRVLDVLGNDPLYQPEYERYVAGMAFAGPPAVVAFDDALAALRGLCETVAA